MPRTDAKKVEAHAHWLLRDFRLAGEWFKVTPADAEKAVRDGIEAVRTGDNLGRLSVGRPPMNLKPTPVRLPIGVAERIDQLLGPNKRAEFIREAVEAELRRREKAKDR